MIIKFVPLDLRMSEAGGGGGGGGSPAGQGGNANPAAPPAAPAPAAQGNGEAPVTRAEFNALMAKIDALGQPPKPPEPPPKPEPPKPDGEAMPEWAKALHGEIVELKTERKTEVLAAKRQQLVNAALTGVPDANRALASLALEGLMASSGVSLEAKDVNLDQLAQQLGTTLRTKHASLFTNPGSQYSAIPAAANGGFDWSGINSMAEVPPEMISKIPDDVYRRLRHGGGAPGGVMPDGSIVPRNRFH